ncbi:MAG: N-acetylglucosamine-6-phosphate deacetylase [Mesorhizobium sp.]|nr:N-acetylglucosamine-6-phosphate deacetylase [Mesorhizobium sp.]MBL8576923.1 N-acetylglucosamine-6-phosphate deacetylase [Mesorhizobium sp.]
MSDLLALAANRIFDGEGWHDNAALLFRGDTVESIVARDRLPPGAQLVDTGAEVLAPGFVDLQVNGGGGVLLNDHPTVEGIETICRAHARFGTTALLPTLITDLPDVTAAAIAAGVAAGKQKVPGFAGLHLEGPHLSLARKGAHDPQLIRAMTETDLSALIDAKRELPTLICTVAPESVTPQQVTALAAGGISVSLGHTDTSYATAIAYVDAGATLATHIFNAMSQLTNREPGLVGAALDDGRLFAGLIADGLHVNPASIGVAMRAKRGPGRIALVTDAMSTIGTTMTEFTLNGRTIYRKDGRLTLADGTLAGADLDMISGVRFMYERIGLELDEALRMASLYPAQAIGRAGRLGHFAKGSAADIVALSHKLNVTGVWIGGRKVSPIS